MLQSRIRTPLAAGHRRSAACRARWVFVCAALMGTIPSAVRAQPPAAGASRSAAVDQDSQRRWYNLGSVPSDEPRAIWALFTLHVFHIDEGISNDRMIGAVWRSAFNGLVRAIVSAGDRKGNVTLVASSPGLLSDTVTVVAH